MSEGQRVAARVPFPPAQRFSEFAYVVMELRLKGEVRRDQAVSMLVTMIHTLAEGDPDNWVEPERSLAESPLVFEALQWSRFRVNGKMPRG